MSSLSSPKAEPRSRGSRYTHETIKNFLEFSIDFSCICTDGIIGSINDAGFRLLKAEDDREIVGKEFSELLGS